MSHGDRFLRILCILLLGYALMGKGFAYIGVAPLYVGEATMIYGIVALIVSENWSRILRTGWLWPLFALMGWGTLRTLPYLEKYGVDALHDAAVWIWGIFAILISSLLAAQPARLLFLEQRFRAFAKWLLILGPISFCISIFANPHLPNAFWADEPYVLVKGGDLVVHLTGIFAFAVLLGGLETAFVVPMMILNLLLFFTGRAAMVTFCAGTAIVTALRPRSPVPWGVFPSLVLGVALLWIFNVHIDMPTHEVGRVVSADQIVQNVESIFIDSGNEDLAGSKEWRLLWWNTIYDYTIRGKYFWEGKGFGINLADDDGFQVELDHSLRNPHNGHLTMLARGGVPMLAIWAACQLTLAYGLVSAAWSAHRRKNKHWFALLAFLFVYWLSYLINASFDVFLEGPVGGIWFWCVYGTGIGAVWIYKNCPEAIEETTQRAAIPAQHRRNPKIAEALGICAS
ncbi:MAG: O-antigen ligase family protein [Tepidisphaeraceae bacterium]